MKKHWKWLIGTVFVIGLAVGGYFYYILNLKTYDIADEDIKELTSESYNLDLPDGVTIDSVGDSNSVEENNSEKTPVLTKVEKTNTEASIKNGNVKTNTKKLTMATSPNSSGQASGQVTVQDIKDKYTPVMVQLEQQAGARIDSLISRAKNEYMEKQAKGESINYAYFYNKYTAAAGELEGRTDEVFYQIINVIEEDLEKNGLSKSKAQVFIDEYEATKKQRRESVLKKVIDQI